MTISPTVALRDLVVVLIDDPHLHPPHRRADRAGLALAVRWVERGDRRGLRQAIPLQHQTAEGFLEAAQHLDRQCRAPGDAHPQGGHVVVRAVRLVQQGNVHRRHAREDGHPVAGEDPQRVVGGEPRQQGQARPRRHRHVERAGLPERVEQRQAAEDHVIRARADDVGAEHLGVAGQVAVGKLGALRLAGRAGCIEDHRGVLVVPVRHLVVRDRGGQEVREAGRVDDDRLGVRPFGAAARIAGEIMPAEHQPGPGVAQVIGDFPHLEQRVHRDDHTAGAKHAVVDDGELGDVGQHDPDPVAGLEAALAQHPGDPRARLVEFGICGRGVIHAHGRLAAVRTHRVHQVRCEVRHSAPPSAEGPCLRGGRAPADLHCQASQPGCPRFRGSSPFPGTGSPAQPDGSGGGMARGWRISWPMLSSDREERARHDRSEPAASSHAPFGGHRTGAAGTAR